MIDSRRLIGSAVVAAALGVVSWTLVPSSPPSTTTPRGPIQRIVSLSPALTEVIYAIGAGDRLVAVSDFTVYPPEATRLPRVGGQVNPNLERLTALQPDLLVLQGEHERVRTFCQQSGAQFWSHRLDSIADLLDTIRTLSRLLGCERQGGAVADRLTGELAALREAVAGRPRPRVFLCVGRQPDRLAGLMTCGRGTFLDDLLQLAGGTNVFADAPVLYPQPSLEELVARAPEVILDLQAETAPSPSARARVEAVWSALTTVPAVRAGRVTAIFCDHALIPSPRIDEVARLFSAALHPTPAAAARP